VVTAHERLENNGYFGLLPSPSSFEEKSLFSDERNKMEVRNSTALKCLPLRTAAKSDTFSKDSRFGEIPRPTVKSG